MNPYIKRILISHEKGAPMIYVAEVSAIAGKGLGRDRYRAETGTYSGKRHNLRHITLIHQGDIDIANQSVPIPFNMEDTRRNLLVVGDINLQDLIDKIFFVGAVKMRGVEECTPCNIPEKMSGKTGFVKAFANGKGGLRAEILTSGQIFIEDEITW